MQKRTNADASPHHIIILVEIPEHLGSHGAVAAVNMAKIAECNKKEVEAGDAIFASDSSAEDGHEGEEDEDIANGVGEAESAR